MASTRCQEVLSKKLAPGACGTFRDARRWTMCRAWNLLDKGEAPSFRESMRRSWREFHAQCWGQEGQ